MKKLHYFAAAAALALAASTAHADGLKPIQAQSLDLGEVSGIGYYTVADDGFHVVATLAHDDTNEKPLRIHAVLLPGQSMVFSTAGTTMAESVSIAIKRQGDEVLVLRNPQGRPARNTSLQLSNK